MACKRCGRLEAEIEELQKRGRGMADLMNAIKDRISSVLGLKTRMSTEVIVARIISEREKHAHLAELLGRVVDKWLPHSGSCCVFDDENNVVVTEESCHCQPLAKECRAALADNPPESKYVAVLQDVQRKLALFNDRGWEHELQEAISIIDAALTSHRLPKTERPQSDEDIARQWMDDMASEAEGEGIEQIEHVITLPPDAFRRLLDMIDNPQEPSEELRALFRKYRPEAKD